MIFESENVERMKAEKREKKVWWISLYKTIFCFYNFENLGRIYMIILSEFFVIVILKTWEGSYMIMWR